jgi:hypothetical protein
MITHKINIIIILMVISKYIKCFRCTEVDACPRSSVVPHWLMQMSCAKMVEMQPTSLSYETIEVDENQKQVKIGQQIKM